MTRNGRSLAGMAIMIAAFQTFPPDPITDFPGKTAVTIVSMPAGAQRDLCVMVPDGRKKVLGQDTFHYYTNRINVEVFAKTHSTAAWGKACTIGDDITSCANVKDAFFLHSKFDLVPYNGHSRSICWSFINRGRGIVDAKLVAHYTLREVKNGFVLYARKPDDKTPLTMAIQADCFCSGDGRTVTGYVARELRPSLGFFATIGDVVEIKVAGKGQQLGIPEGCSRELTGGTYHVQIQHIFPFEQPAVYKSVIQGLITSEPLTDVSKIFSIPDVAGK